MLYIDDQSWTINITKSNRKKVTMYKDIRSYLWCISKLPEQKRRGSSYNTWFCIASKSLMHLELRENVDVNIFQKSFKIHGYETNSEGIMREQHRNRS